MSTEPKYQRILYNIFLIAAGEVQLETELLDNSSIFDVLHYDYNIPEDFRLKLAWIDNGSIWLTLKGTLASLKYLSKFYVKGATATFEQKISQAEKLENESKINQQTRDSVISKIIEEQEALKLENISKKYELWRNETRANISFADELIAQVKDKKVAEELRKQKDIAISQLISQKILPVVRNYPRELSKDESNFLLPPSSLESD